MNRRRVMGRDVEDHAGAALGCRESPASETVRQPAGVEDPHGERFPDVAVGDESLNRAVRSRSRQVMIRGERHACAPAGVDHLRCVLRRQGERLFAQDVLSGGCGGDCLRPVQIVDGADVDGVEVVARQ
jgi:hypothetical protein